MQQGMLFHRVGNAGPGVDVEQVICEMNHAVSPPEFEQAWSLIVQRHETLRTGFRWVEGEEPRQFVRPAAEITLPMRVLRVGRARDAERVLEQYLAADRKAGFAELTAPLARIALLLSDEGRAWFVFTYHHLVLDARGMYTLFKEALDLHDALARGETVTLPPVRPYRDYIAWLQTLDGRRAEGFWRDQLQGLQTPTALPLPPPEAAAAAVEVGAGELATHLGAGDTRRLRAAAARHGVTVNTILQGAWALVLSRYTGEDDVVFGAVRACRHVPLEGVGGMIGMMINTVPLRVRLAAAASVDHWLRDLREQWIALRDYEHTPLMQVRQWSDVAPGRPLFDTIFNYQEPSWIGGLRELGGVWNQRTFDIRSQPGYPLALDIYGDETVLIRAFYDRRRFGAEAVAQLLGHFRAAIAGLADGKADILGHVTLLSELERNELLQRFNATAADYPREVTVPALVEGWAAREPTRVAVADAHGTWTYGELNARADALAAALRDRGVGCDVLVAVCMTRSREMIAAWLGILKAGGAFVPLDPSYPPERLAFQLRDSGAPVILTQPHLRGILPELPPGVSVIEIDPASTPDLGTSLPDHSTRAVATPRSDALAYVIYTSGSTGQPKGVQIEHRALMNLVSWHQRTYAVKPNDRATHLASPAFDASVWEIWPYLTAGASVHIPDDETRISPAALWQWFAANGITLGFLPTPLAEAALAQPWPTHLALRALLTGGDQLKRPAPSNFPCPVINHYGPTENTVVATAGVVATRGAGTPPIGRPIQNTTCYVLDRELRPVPFGVPGELYIGGESLARGYHARPELTAEKFVTNPFATIPPSNAPLASVNPAARLYRTGDLVRWRSDGQLEFLGRIDNQVKIRGCRIELGEVEAVLERHPQVREAVAIARPDDRGQVQLLAYVVATPSAAPTEDELSEHLRQLLPAYMVPASIGVLEAWPLTANGKIDRRALPPPGVRAIAVANAESAPVAGREQVIARIFSEVLGRTSIGRHDNFFELGGHSLLAAQAMTRLNAALDASISVRVLFDHPTVAAFASAVEQHAGAAPRAPALRPKRRSPASELELVQPR